MTPRIPIHIVGEPGVGYGLEPLTFGVPFAEGALPSGTRLRCVTADGRELPLQTAEVTTWKKDLKHVKWLLADLQADHARDGATLWLEAAGIGESKESRGSTKSIEAIQSNNSVPSISASSASGLLTIDTGALRLTLRTDFPRWQKREWDSPFVGCEVKTADGNWREALRGPGFLLYMKDQHGNRYTSLGGCPAPTVRIEEQGPLRVCVLITGYLMSEQGVRFCPYRLRIHLYAGKADLRLFHTFVFDQAPARIVLKAIGLKVCARSGDGVVAAVGGAQALSPALSETLSAPEFDKARDKEGEALSLLQSDDLHYAITRAGEFCASGEKAPGWASLGGANACVVAAVRDFWQEYPKGFGVTPDALDVRIWPEDTPEPLRFTTPFDEPPIWFNGTRDEAEVKRLLAERPAAPLALKSFGVKDLNDIAWIEEIVERLAPGRAKSYCDFMGIDTGVGAAKTTEIVLRFTAGAVADEEASAFALTVQEPLVAIVAPAYIASTRALGHFLPAGHPLFVDIDRNLDEQYEKTLPEPTRLGRLYGMLEWGQLRNGHTMCGGPPAGDLVYHYYKTTAPEKALRYVGPWNNESVDAALGPWGQFLRTGRRRDLRQAQVTARAIADVSFIHASPEDPHKTGCMHYHGAHVWSAGPSRSHSEVGFMMADYYLTGNRRMREVAIEAADGIVDNKIEPCGIINCFSRLFREYTGPLSILMDAYQLTWHEKYGTPAQRSLHWLLHASRTPGWLPGSVYTGGPRGAAATVEPEEMLQGGATNTYHVFEPAVRLFPSRALNDFLLAFAERACRTGLGEAGVSICMAYDLTRKPEYAAAALAKIRAHCRPHPPERVVCFYDIYALDFAPRMMSIVARAWEKDPAGFLAFAERWAKERMNDKDAPFPRNEPQAAREYLGVLSTEHLDNRAEQ